jgi:hypothetical protein
VKNLIHILFILAALPASGQEKMHISDSLTFSYATIDWLPEVDSVVQMKFPTDSNIDDAVCNEIEVYFDKGLKHLAYESKVSGDSCFTYDYWRNGQLKRKNTYLTGLENWEGIPIDWHYLAYCENGQLIRDYPSPNSRTDKYLVTYYYCSGNKKLEYYQLGPVVDGLMTEWYDHGKVKSETFYENGQIKKKINY